jgi:hypothetical protein
MNLLRSSIENPNEVAAHIRASIEEYIPHLVYHVSDVIVLVTKQLQNMDMYLPFLELFNSLNYSSVEMKPTLVVLFNQMFRIQQDPDAGDDDPVTYEPIDEESLKGQLSTHFQRFCDVFHGGVRFGFVYDKNRSEEFFHETLERTFLMIDGLIQEKVRMRKEKVFLSFDTISWVHHLGSVVQRIHQGDRPQQPDYHWVNQALRCFGELLRNGDDSIGRYYTIAHVLLAILCCEQSGSKTRPDFGSFKGIWKYQYPHVRNPTGEELEIGHIVFDALQGRLSDDSLFGQAKLELLLSHSFVISSWCCIFCFSTDADNIKANSFTCKQQLGHSICKNCIAQMESLKQQRSHTLVLNGILSKFLKFPEREDLLSLVIHRGSCPHPLCHQIEPEVSPIKPSLERKYLNILLFGPARSGKSAFVNSALSVLSSENDIIQMAIVGGGTSSFHSYPLVAIENGKVHLQSQFQLFDTWAMETGAYTDELFLAMLAGRIKAPFAKSDKIGSTGTAISPIHSVLFFVPIHDLLFLLEPNKEGLHKATGSVFQEILHYHRLTRKSYGKGLLLKDFFFFTQVFNSRCKFSDRHFKSG